MENNPALRILPRCSAFLTALALCLACLLWPGAAWSASPQGALDNYEQRRRNVASLLEAATVFVFSRTDDTIHFGSGFFVADGYVLTNAHVVEDAEPDEIYIANDALPPVKASIVSISHQSGSSEDSLPKRDFALLRYSHPTSGKRPFLSFNLDVRRMDRVSAWGFPGMVTQFDQRMQAILEDKVSARDFAPPPVVYTEGTVSALVKSGGEAVIHTAAIAGGNSGGPLVNRKGEVVGVNTWGYKEEEEGAFINAALPAHTAIAFLQENGIQPTLAADNAASPPSAPALAPAETTPGRSQTPPARNRPKRPGAGGETASSPQDAGEDSRLTNGDALALLKQARSGDVDAIAAVGACYLEEEEGFPRDYVQARLWLEKSAAAGNALGQGLLGFLYLGLYDPDLHEPEKALELLKISASAPEPDPD
ncbi:MAG: trypsin-like peptidase domain-containing protein, partial [Desulfovibrio sp.]|nr:trypsin-like peptidase domain-containing protein [Desulfovibrio sp.]